jgi:hypothetical protein
MRFTHRGREVDTEQMSAFATGHPFTPHIYVDRDQECFVAQHRNGWTEPKLRYVPRHEARRLAELYNVEDLKVALAEPPAKHLKYHDPASGKLYDTRSMARFDLGDGAGAAVFVAEDRRCFTLTPADGGGELKELSHEEAGKLAEIFGLHDLRALLGKA